MVDSMATARGGMKDRRGRVTRESRKAPGSVTDLRPRHREAEKSTPPRVLVNSHDRAAWIDPPIGAKYTQRVFGPCSRARKETQGARKCDVFGIFVNDPGEVWNLSRGVVT